MNRFGRKEFHGVAPGCDLLAFKVLDHTGNGLIEDTCLAAEEIMRLNSVHRGLVRIVNISVGMPASIKPEQQKRLLAAVEAIWDSGVALHQDLQSKIIYFKDYIHHRSQPYDDNGHGTHVCGIIGAGQMNRFGRKEFHGVAPGCDLLAFKVLDHKGNGLIEDTCLAAEEIMRLNSVHRGLVRIVNISVGMPASIKPEQQKRLLAAVEAIWDSGVVVIAAAGNNGPGENTVTSPGISKKIITVGSLDDGSQNPGNGYSGRGPTGECVMKPEILMPGTNILSCRNRRTGYARKSGTSMAAPVLSGMIALLLNAHPQLTPNDVKMRLFYAAQKNRDTDTKTWGTVTVDALL